MGKIPWTMYLKYFSKYCLEMYLNGILRYFMVNVFKILWPKHMLYFSVF